MIFTSSVVQCAPMVTAADLYAVVADDDDSDDDTICR